MANSNQRKLIVGIDFGTTYTGVAWAETRRVCGYLDSNPSIFLF
jgi:molecular chaperone DnaK (HSP70)